MGHQHTISRVLNGVCACAGYGALAGVPVAHAQQPPQPASMPPAYRLLRFDENYQYLQDPAKRSDRWDPIKYIPVDAQRGWYVSLGGEMRERFESYSRPNLGLQGQSGNSYVLQRVLVHTDIHLGESFRTFVQLGSHLAFWKDAAGPPYQDRLDLQQAFVDIRLPLELGADHDPYLRIGRQEMVFGSQRLIAIRDAPNVRRNFDGLRVGLDAQRIRVDAFVMRPVLLRDGVFDDKSDNAQKFWGVYTTTPLSDAVAGLDLYYLGLENENARFASISGSERRGTIGTRFFSGAAQRGWDWDWELLGQFGSLERQDIRAWGFSTDTGYSRDIAGWKVRFGIKADFGSGDRDPNDSKLQTLNPLFPKLAYFNQAALFGPSNVLDLQPSISFEAKSKLKLTAGLNLLWRATTAEAIYTGAGAPIAGTAGEPGGFTASQLAIDFSWPWDRHLQLDAGCVLADVGDALRAAGGHDDTFVYASAGYKF